MKYFHIIKFLLTHDLTELKKYWEVEFIHKEFRWRRLLRKVAQGKNPYFALWRMCKEVHTNGNKKQRKAAIMINDKLTSKYSVDISLQTEIGINFMIMHYMGIAICNTAKIGCDVVIRQNTTIGQRNTGDRISIGDKVNIGANSCILASNNKIGNNVIIGAMSFINKDIPDNCTVYTEKTNKIIIK